MVKSLFAGTKASLLMSIETHKKSALVASPFLRSSLCGGLHTVLTFLFLLSTASSSHAHSLCRTIFQKQTAQRVIVTELSNRLLKRRLKETTAQLAMQPTDPVAVRHFERVTREIIDKDYQNIPAIFKAYRRVLKNHPPIPENLEPLLRSMQNFSALTHMNGSPLESVILGFSSLLIDGLRRNTITATKVLETLAWLQKQKVRFVYQPTSIRFVGGSNWILGDFHRILSKQQESTHVIEEAIFEQFQNIQRISSKIYFIANLKKTKKYYRISDELNRRLNIEFISWLHREVPVVSSKIDLQTRVGPLTIDQLFYHSKRVVNLRDFVQENLSKTSQGYLFGSSGLLYDALADLSSLLHFRWAYFRHWMTLTMPESRADIKRKIFLFMSRVKKTNRPIVFLLSSKITTTIYTNLELECLAENPEILSRVTFVTLD